MRYRDYLIKRAAESKSMWSSAKDYGQKGLDFAKDWGKAGLDFAQTPAGITTGTGAAIGAFLGWRNAVKNKRTGFRKALSVLLGAGGGGSLAYGGYKAYDHLSGNAAKRKAPPKLEYMDDDLTQHSEKGSKGTRTKPTRSIQMLEDQLRKEDRSIANIEATRTAAQAKFNAQRKALDNKLSANKKVRDDMNKNEDARNRKRQETIEHNRALDSQFNLDTALSESRRQDPSAQIMAGAATTTRGIKPLIDAEREREARRQRNADAKRQKKHQAKQKSFEDGTDPGLAQLEEQTQRGYADSARREEKAQQDRALMALRTGGSFPWRPDIYANESDSSYDDSVIMPRSTMYKWRPGMDGVSSVHPSKLNLNFENLPSDLDSSLRQAEEEAAEAARKYYAMTALSTGFGNRSKTEADRLSREQQAKADKLRREQQAEELKYNLIAKLENTQQLSPDQKGMMQSEIDYGLFADENAFVKRIEQLKKQNANAHQERLNREKVIANHQATQRRDMLDEIAKGRVPAQLDNVRLTLTNTDGTELVATVKDLKDMKFPDGSPMFKDDDIRGMLVSARGKLPKDANPELSALLYEMAKRPFSAIKGGYRVTGVDNYDNDSIYGRPSDASPQKKNKITSKPGAYSEEYLP